MCHCSIVTGIVNILNLCLYFSLFLFAQFDFYSGGTVKICLNLGGKYGDQTMEVSAIYAPFFLDNGAKSGECKDPDSLDDNEKKVLDKTSLFCVTDGKVVFDIWISEPVKDWIEKTDAGVIQGACLTGLDRADAGMAPSGTVDYQEAKKKKCKKDDDDDDKKGKNDDDCD